MRNKLSIFILSFVVFSFVLVGQPVFAQESDFDANEETTTVEEPRVLPDSPFYGFKIALENFVDVFIVGKAQAERNIKLAEERLREAKAMEKKNKPEKAQKAIERAQKRHEQTSGLIDSLDNEEEQAELLESVQESIIKHSEVLADVLEKANESARDGLDRAIINSSKLEVKLQEVEAKVLEKAKNRKNDKAIKMIEKARAQRANKQNRESISDKDEEDEEENND